MIYTINRCLLCAIETIISLRLQADMDGAEGSRTRAAARRAALSASSPSPNDVKKKHNR